jgi:hypothetical protein
VDVTTLLSLPGDCTTGDPNPQVAQDLSLNVSTATPINSIWSVTCTAQSTHSFTASSSVTVDQLHVEDPAAGNDSLASSAALIPVFATADGKITSAIVLSPPTSIASNVNVNITIRKVLHNNGPFGSAAFSLTRSITPPAGCTVTVPAPTSHNLAMSTPATVDEVWTVNCNPGSYTFNFFNTLSPSTLHVLDPNAANNSALTPLSVIVDTDGDGIPDNVEVGCGSNPNNGLSIPERIDGVYAGVDDDLDVQIDEALPAGSVSFDCDRDGYIGSTENHLYSPNTQGNQDPCGTNVIPPTVPATAVGWPADTNGNGGSAGLVNLLDLTSFLAPIRYLGTNVGAHPGDRRWDLVPGAGVLTTDINLVDLTNLLVVKPPMLGGPRAFGGPACPFPA